MPAIRNYAPVANPHLRAWMGGHAKSRARERYDLDLSDDDLDAIARLVASKDPRAVFLRHYGYDHFRRVLAVRWAGAWLCCAYDDGTRTVVTFLPETELEPYRPFLEKATARLKRKAEPELAPVAEEVAPSVAEEVAPSVAESDPSPPVGTILGMVDFGPIPPFPRYEPPSRVPTTVAEARARVAELEECLLGMARCIFVVQSRRQDALRRELESRRLPVRVEKASLVVAIRRTKAAAVRAGDFGPIEDRPLVGVESPSAESA